MAVCTPAEQLLQTLTEQLEARTQHFLTLPDLPFFPSDPVLAASVGSWFHRFRLLSYGRPIVANRPIIAEEERKYDPNNHSHCRNTRHSRHADPSRSLGCTSQPRRLRPARRTDHRPVRARRPQWPPHPAPIHWHKPVENHACTPVLEAPSSLQIQGPESSPQGCVYERRCQRVQVQTTRVPISARRLTQRRRRVQRRSDRASTRCSQRSAKGESPASFKQLLKCSRAPPGSFFMPMRRPR